MKKAFVFILVFAASAVLLALLFSLLITPAIFGEKGKEIVSKRTYNAKAFSNGDATFTWNFSTVPIHFWDGEMYVDLNLATEPDAETQKKILSRQANYASDINSIEFGEFLLHKGITATMDENKLRLIDANNHVALSLGYCTATDANKSIEQSACRIMMQESGKIRIFFDLNKEWLELVIFPVTLSLRN